MGKMLETKFDCEESCLSCGSTETRTVKVTIKRKKREDILFRFTYAKGA